MRFFCIQLFFAIGLVCLVQAAEDQKAMETSGQQLIADQPQQPDAVDTTNSEDSAVGSPHHGGYHYGSRSYHSKSFGGGYGHSFGGYKHGFGGGHGTYTHTRYSSHSSGYGGGGFLRATHDDPQNVGQEQEPIVGSAYASAGPQIPCPQNIVVQCQPSVAPLGCSGGY